MTDPNRHVNNAQEIFQFLSLPSFYTIILNIKNIQGKPCLYPIVDKKIYSTKKILSTDI